MPYFLRDRLPPISLLKLFILGMNLRAISQTTKKEQIDHYNRVYAVSEREAWGTSPGGCWGHLTQPGKQVARTAETGGAGGSLGKTDRPVCSKLGVPTQSVQFHLTGRVRAWEQQKLTGEKDSNQHSLTRGCSFRWKGPVVRYARGAALILSPHLGYTAASSSWV